MERIEAVPIEARWHPGLPIFASESFLKAVGDEYGWIGGAEESGRLRCILPYTVIRKMGIRLVRFRIETIPIGEELQAEEERHFLDAAVNYLRSIGADIIIPATTNSVFRTYPTGAAAVPYGSYIIDLCQSEEAIWRGIGRITRQNIKTAEREGVRIRENTEHLDAIYDLIFGTFKRSKIQFMSYESFSKYVLGLGQNVKILVADHENTIHSCVLFAFSNYCAYAVYAGNREDQNKGAHKLLHWEAIRMFRDSGVKRYDLVGARIDPQKGSKQEAIKSFKTRLGAELKQGYMWKYSLRPAKSLVYTLGVRLLRGGDIVDRERHGFKNGGDPQ